LLSLCDLLFDSHAENAKILPRYHVPLNTNPKGEKKAKFPQQGETQMKPEKEIKDNISGHTKGGTSKKHRSSGS